MTFLQVSIIAFVCFFIVMLLFVFALVVFELIVQTRCLETKVTKFNHFVLKDQTNGFKCPEKITFRRLKVNKRQILFIVNIEVQAKQGQLSYPTKNCRFQ